jgi:polyisoprenoid-binding protein YceI
MAMIKSKIWVLFLVMALNASAQKFVSERSVITFFSSATLEDITAKNEKASSIINLSSVEIAFSVPIKSFQFEKQLMQQHFNERYMESDKFPKATFAGKIEGLQPSVSATQQVKANGKLTIHGVTRDVTIPGTIEVTSTKIVIKAKFLVKLADYKIEIPKLLWQNIAEQVEVTIEFVYKPQ